MLFINDQLPHVDSIRKKHCQLIICYVTRKIEGASAKFKCADLKCPMCTSDIRKAKNISSRFENAFKSIEITKVISGKPDELVVQYQKFHTAYFSGLAPRKFNISEKKVLNSIFNYDWFSNKETKVYNAYDLCNALKIESCVYCNRLYTSTIINKNGVKIIRPTLDHWFSQKDCPILALSFYNLIPSCSSCNSSVKHDSTFDLLKHIHPYVDMDVTNNYKLDYIYDTSLNKFIVSITTTDKKIKDTLGEMFISDIYSHHQSEIADLDILKRKYNKEYLKNLGLVLDKKLKEKDIYRILFGVEYDDENFHKRPLSKLKKDILNFRIK